MTKPVFFTLATISSVSWTCTNIFKIEVCDARLCCRQTHVGKGCNMQALFSSWLSGSSENLLGTHSLESFLQLCRYSFLILFCTFSTAYRLRKSTVSFCSLSKGLLRKDIACALLGIGPRENAHNKTFHKDIRIVWIKWLPNHLDWLIRSQCFTLDLWFALWKQDLWNPTVCLWKILQVKHGCRSPWRA